MNKTLSRLSPAVALCAPVLALGPAAASDTAAAKAPSSAPRYQSAFADYKAWQEVKPGDWRQLNDNVAPASGRTRAAVRHGTSSGTAAPSASASVFAPAAAAHRRHPMHGGNP